jgi:hypothetical protein
MSADKLEKERRRLLAPPNEAQEPFRRGARATRRQILYAQHRRQLSLLQQKELNGTIA